MNDETLVLFVGFVSPYLIELGRWLAYKMTNVVLSGKLMFSLTVLISFAIAIIALVFEKKVELTFSDIMSNWALILAASQVSFKLLQNTKVLPRIN